MLKSTILPSKYHGNLCHRETDGKNIIFVFCIFFSKKKAKDFISVSFTLPKALQN
jgi:hypothetical protein